MDDPTQYFLKSAPYWDHVTTSWPGRRGALFVVSASGTGNPSYAAALRDNLFWRWMEAFAWTSTPSTADQHQRRRGNVIILTVAVGVDGSEWRTGATTTPTRYESSSHFLHNASLLRLMADTLCRGDGSCTKPFHLHIAYRTRGTSCMPESLGPGGGQCDDSSRYSIYTVTQQLCL